LQFAQFICEQPTFADKQQQQGRYQQVGCCNRKEVSHAEYQEYHGQATTGETLATPVVLAKNGGQQQLNTRNITLKQEQ
jgi:hypothetical protein